VGVVAVYGEVAITFLQASQLAGMILVAGGIFGGQGKLGKTFARII